MINGAIIKPLDSGDVLLERHWREQLLSENVVLGGVEGTRLTPPPWPGLPPQSSIRLHLKC